MINVNDQLCFEIAAIFELRNIILSLAYYINK